MRPDQSRERTVTHSGRIVVAMECVLADAQWRSWPAAQPGPLASHDTHRAHFRNHRACHGFRFQCGGSHRTPGVRCARPSGLPVHGCRRENGARRRSRKGSTNHHHVGHLGHSFRMVGLRPVRRRSYLPSALHEVSPVRHHGGIPRSCGRLSTSSLVVPGELQHLLACLFRHLSRCRPGAPVWAGRSLACAVTIILSRGQPSAPALLTR